MILESRETLSYITLFIILNISIYGCQVFELDFYQKNVNNKNHTSQKTASNEYNPEYDSTSTKIFQEEIPIAISRNNEMIVNLCLGTPKQCFNVLLDSGSFYLWVADISSANTPDARSKFNKTESSTYANLSIPLKINYGTGSASGFVSADTFSFGEIKLDRLQFLLADKEEAQEGLDGIVGLGYQYEDYEKDAEKFSILDQLYKNKLISKRVFSQKYINNNGGKLYIGDLPSEIKEDMDNYGNCSALQKTSWGVKNPKWECSLRAFFFGSENQSKHAKVLEQRALFDTGTNVIICPLSILMELKSTYFKNLLDRGLCNLETDIDDFYTFVCLPYAPLLGLPDINFIFGDYVLKMKSKDLFEKNYDGAIRFVMVVHINIDEWIFGVPLLKKFHFVFDKDSDVIGFYGRKDKFRSDLPFPVSYVHFIIYFFVFLSILSLGLIIWGVIRYVRNTRTTASDYYDQNAYLKFGENSSNRNRSLLNRV